jgi:hypothetical protein
MAEMSVKKGEGRGSVPDSVRLKDFEVRYPPQTIEHNVDLAKGKAKMRFVHPQLEPEQAEGEERGEGGIKHRAVTGAKGMPSGS